MVAEAGSRGCAMTPHQVKKELVAATAADLVNIPRAIEAVGSFCTSP